MRILASVVALVLVGLTGGWLWMDATAQAGHDTDGVVITGAVDASTAQALVGTPQDDDPAPDGTSATSADGTASRSASLDDVVTLLGASSDALISRADEVRQADQEAEKEAAEQKAAEEKVRKEAQQATEPIPVQPAPVTPGGWCEWDDDDYEWDCDDDWDDDDWDDDDWDDDR